MDETQTYRLFWQKRPDGGARLLRLYASHPQIYLPAEIMGYPLVEIAPYCFSQARRPLEGNYEETAVGSARHVQEGYLQEMCGTALEHAVLPDTVQTIGSFAFYGCKKLRSLQIGANTREIGSDAFMNTVSLRRIVLHAHPGQKSGIRKILAQISSDLEIQFQTGTAIEAALLYPDYYESYDEIAPAHLFGRNISGEGFRARQCFEDGRVDFTAYDEIFLQACAEESEKTLAHMALNRLQYPYGLSLTAGEHYRKYVAEHIAGIASELVRRKNLTLLEFLCRENMLFGDNLANCAAEAAGADWPEGAASLLRRQSLLGRTMRARRYDFDAF